MSETVNVRGASDSNYESMTKEQILAAIVQAVEEGEIENVDTGFVTTIKEINKNIGLRFWVGTTAEYEAIATKEDNVLYIKTDDTSASDINDWIETLYTRTTNLGRETDRLDTRITDLEETDTAKIVQDTSGGGAIAFAADDTIITLTLDTPFTTSQIANYLPIVKMYVDSGVSVPNGFKWTHFVRSDKLIIIGDNTAGSTAFTARFAVAWIKNAP